MEPDITYETNYCRTCMEKITINSSITHLDSSDSFNDTVTLRHKLSICVPELDLENVNINPIICSICVLAVNFTYDFKQQCLKTEKKLLDDVTKTEVLSMTKYEICEADVIDYTQLEVVDSNLISFNACIDVKECDLEILEPAKNTTQYDSPILRTILDQSLQPFKCELCKFSTLYKSEMERHSNLHNSYKCAKCCFESLNKEKYDEHQKFHIRKCNICEFETSSFKKFSDHLNNHINNYKCDVCFKTFKHSNTFIIHKRLHKNVDETEVICLD